MRFNVGIDALPDFGTGMKLVEAALPENVSVAVSGTKWTVAKALSLKYQKVKENGSVRYELPIPDGNVAGLKLKYTTKNGQFKGSFKMYATDADGGASASGHDNGGSAASGRNPKLKKYTVNVVGFVVDGVGIGEARCKKPAAGPWSVTVE